MGPVAGRSVPKILYGFGRADQLDRDAVKRLVGSLARLLDPADAQAATTGAELTFCESRPFGGTFTLDALWRRLGIDTVLTSLDTDPDGKPRPRSAPRGRGDRAGAVRAGRQPGARPVLEAGRMCCSFHAPAGSDTGLRTEPRGRPGVT